MTVMRRLRVPSAVVAGVLALVAAGSVAGANGASSVSARSLVASAKKRAPVKPTLPAIVKPPKGTVLIATIKTPTLDYAAPVLTGSGKPIGKIPTSWHNSTVALPVIAQRPGWLHVRLPWRPNMSTAWIRSTAPSLSYTGYSVTINVASMRLMLYLRGKLLMNAPAGIGTTWDPTPLGQYFVAYVAEPPSPGYGPFVIVTSAHSNKITDWEASGDAEIGIHGPLGMDAAIGTKGARISHGCVRLHLSNLALLRQLPLGTPINVIA